jgi:hypothetical protein
MIKFLKNVDLYKKDISLAYIIWSGSGAQSSFLYNGFWGLFPRGVKQLGCEADSRPTKGVVKKTWIYISTPLCTYISIPPYIVKA